MARTEIPSSVEPCGEAAGKPHRGVAKPLTRCAFAWLLAIALVLGFLALPALAVLAAELGHPTLATEMLHFKPVWLLPLSIGA